MKIWRDGVSTANGIHCETGDIDKLEPSPQVALVKDGTTLLSLGDH
jgi:hypothetical protein